jgi:putative acetyltransferase
MSETPVTIRSYASGDALDTLAIFLDAVTTTAAADYSPEQIAAWAAPQERDAAEWGESRAQLESIVAVLDGRVVGFSDVSADGYIHMLFVSPRFSRRGVAHALLIEVERRARAANAESLLTNASITARPFFERHGFVVLDEQHPVMRGVLMTNYRMTRQLS